MVCVGRPDSVPRSRTAPTAAKEGVARALRAPRGGKENRSNSICITVPSVDAVSRDPLVPNQGRSKSITSTAAHWSFSDELQRAKNGGSTDKSRCGMRMPQAESEERCPNCVALRRRAARAESVADDVTRMHEAVLEELEDLRVAHAAAQEAAAAGEKARAALVAQLHCVEQGEGRQGAADQCVGAQFREDVNMWRKFCQDARQLAAEAQERCAASERCQQRTEQEVQKLRAELEAQAAERCRERDLWHDEIDSFAAEFSDLRIATAAAVGVAADYGAPARSAKLEQSDQSVQTALLRPAPLALSGEALCSVSDTPWRRRLRARSLDRVGPAQSEFGMQRVALHSFLSERRHVSGEFLGSVNAWSPRTSGESHDACWSSVDGLPRAYRNTEARGVLAEREVPSP